MSTPSRISEIMAEMEQNPDLAGELRNRLLGAQYAELPAAVAQNQSLILSLMERQAELAHATHTAMEALTETVEILLGAVAETREMLASQGQRLEAVEQITSELRTVVSALQTDMTEVKADVAELKADMVEVKTDVAELKADMVEVKADVAELKADMVEVKADVAELKADMVEVKADVAELKADMVEVKADVAELKADMVEVKADVAELKADMVEVKADVAELKADMVEVKADVAELKTDMTEVKSDIRRIEGRLDNGFGTNYEAKIASNIGSILGTNLRLRRCRVLKGHGFRVDEDLEEMIEKAEREGAITEDEWDEAMLLDLVASGRRREGENTELAGIEVSITAGADDVTRAVERSEILSKATGLTVTPVVIASNIDEERRRLAAEWNVTMIVHPEG